MLSFLAANQTHMKKRQIWALMLGLLLMAGFVACDKDDKPVDPTEKPDEPANQPGDDEPETPVDRPDLESLITGKWVSVDDEEWMLASFADVPDALPSEKTLTLSSASLKNDGSENLKISVGSSTLLTASKFMRWSLEKGSITNEEWALVFSDWSTNEFTVKVEVADGTEKTRTFHKLLSSRFVTKGAVPGLSLDALKMQYQATEIRSLNDNVIKINGNNVEAVGYGASYLTLKTDRGTAVIEVVCSPITEMPYPFEKLLGATVWYKHDEPSESDRKRFEKIEEILSTNYEGIEKISEVTDFTNTLVLIDGISITFNQDVKPVAIWTMFNRLYQPRFISYSQDNAIDFIIHEQYGSRSMEIYWEIGTSEIYYN